MIHPQQKNIIALGLLTAAILGIFVFVTLPFARQLQSKSDAVYQERIDTAIAQQRAQDLRATEQEYSKLKSSSQAFGAFFVKDQTVLQFISSMEVIAQRTSVTQDIQNLQSPASGKGDSAFLIHLGGTFQELLAYLAALQTAPTYVALDRMTFAAGSNADRLDLTLQARVQWQ